MDADKIEVGQRLTYYPHPQDSCDLLHFPALVEKVGKRLKVKIFMDSAPEGVTKYVSAKRLVIQNELPI